MKKRPQAGIIYGEGMNDWPSATAESIQEDDPAYTGLLDAQGNPLYRKKAPMGFQISKTPRGSGSRKRGV